MTATSTSKTYEERLEYGPVRIKVDSTGLPLLPKPSTSPFDPLNYPNWLRYTILAEICTLSFLAFLNIAIINPAAVPLAAEFDITPVMATYQTTIAIGAGALGPLIFTPFANVYGRRPAYLLSILIGFASALGSAKSKSFGTLILARAMNVGPSAALGLGAGTVVDVFFVHERGKAMGLFTLAGTYGAHLSAIVGGYVAGALGWRWCFYLGAILDGAMFIICFFFLPETLFDRPESDLDVQVIPSESELDENEPQPSFIGEPFTSPPMSLKTYLNRLWIIDLERPLSRRLKMNDFIIKPFSMLKYPSVIFPGLFYGVVYAFASIGPSLTVAPLFTEIYHFDTVRNGLANGVSLVVGASLGELCSSPITDAMMQRARRKALRQGLPASAEIRLHGIWTGAFAVPAGLLIWLHGAISKDIYRAMYWDGQVYLDILSYLLIDGVFDQAIGCFGVQVINSVVYTYSCSDCYRTRSNDVSQCFNFFRQLFGLPLGFYSIPFGERIGFQWSFTVFAGICIIAFLPIVGLIFRGEQWRRKLGEPS